MMSGKSSANSQTRHTLALRVNVTNVFNDELESIIWYGHERQRQPYLQRLCYWQP